MTSIRIGNSVVAVSLAALLATACGPKSSDKTGDGTGSGVTTKPTAPLTKAERAEAMVRDLAALRWDKLGSPVVRWDSIPPVLAPKDKPHKILMVLVEFDDVGFERFRDKKDQGQRLAAFYQDWLFDETYSKEGTLSNYFYDQSDGKYAVTGTVLPPVKLSKKRAAYGRPYRPEGGSWRNDADTRVMVEEALDLVRKNSKVDWADYDRWDPIDHDKDGVIDEPDGYIDHFVLVHAGGAQSSCQLLQNIGSILTPNAGSEAVGKLNPRQLECADRPWPHRASVEFREGLGPKVGPSLVNRRGGVPMSDALWVYDYNMQSEYTAPATFIHEFGHSIGLPDIYARNTTNSTGSWELMSGTTDPVPQNLSAWSRLQLGWLTPKVVLPPKYAGGAPSAGSIPLARLGDQAAKDARAIMVVLPPKEKVIELAKLPPESGKTALYGGQGNDMKRTMTRKYDLSKATAAKVSFDAWWDIEPGWDFAYVEVSTDAGQSWKRQLPIERKYMPAKHGHDGKKTLPGLTGYSGDFDGDGKNESIKACDPKKDVKHGEDSAGQKKDPCTESIWVTVGFDLKEYLGKSDVLFRIRYFTDPAAVNRGILVDNVVLKSTMTDNKVVVQLDNFEGSLGADSGWTFDGFSPSTGRHEILVPHYYLIEYRDPYAAKSYDKALAKSSYSFYYDPASKQTLAVEYRRRPGVVVWYADGTYAWSDNEPTINGSGKGYLLVVDSNPNEIKLPGLEKFYRGDPGAFDTHYDVKSDEAQRMLMESYQKTTCFIRTKPYLPATGLAKPCPRGAPPVKRLQIEGRIATYSYEVINEFLPGNRGGLRKVSEFIDTRTRKDKVSYRLRDRSLRTYHTYDAPFSADPFERGIVIYKVTKKGLVETEARSYPAVANFDDSGAGRWLNAKLPFDGVAVPGAGFSFQVKKNNADTSAAAIIDYKFEPAK